MLTKEKVIEAVRMVNDPELMLSIVDLGLVYDVAISESPKQETSDKKNEDDGKKYKVEISMTLTSPACPYGPMLIEWTKYTAEKVEGVKEAQVKVVWDPVWDPRTMATEEVRLQLGLL